MKKRGITLILLAVTLCFAAQSFAQFTPEELAQRAKWEELLIKGKVVKKQDLGQGVTRPKRLFLKKDDFEGSGVWKQPTSTDAGLFDKWECEVAAYRLDKLLELGEQIEKMIYLSRAFDSLIANTDRSLQNIRFTPDWRLILIDHSRAFRSSRSYREQLMYGKYGKRKPLDFPLLPRKFVEKVRGLTYNRIRAAVGEYLTSDEIKAIIDRKTLLLKEIEEMIQERGEENVLY